MNKPSPVTIKRGDFTVYIYNVPDFLDFPVTNLRKLWKIMFETAWENTAAIDTIAAWLPVVLAETKAQKTKHAKAHKLQVIFKKLAENRFLGG